MIHATLAAIGVQGVRLHISNRKILEGYLTGLGFTDYVAAIRWLDKGEKIKPDDLLTALAALPGANGAKAEAAVKIATIKTTDSSFVTQVKALGVSHTLLDEGLEELAFVMDRLKHLPAGDAIADLSIARGFDYYT